MEISRVAPMLLALMVAGCDFGIDTKGLVGDGGSPADVATGDVDQTEATTDAPPAETGPATLLGDTNVETTSVTIATSSPHGYRFQASASGNAQKVFVYVDSQTSGAIFDVGLYDDDATQSTPQPKSLLAQATFSASPGLWNSQPISSTAIQSGSFYWIVINATTATLYYRLAGGTSGTIESVAASSSSLPATWTTSSTAMDGPASMYVTE